MLRVVAAGTASLPKIIPARSRGTPIIKAALATRWGAGSFVAKLLSRNGVAVLASFISPYRAVRQMVREETTNFIEVFVEVP